MIANISPAASTFEDTYNTLKYANRAKKIKTNLNRNVLSVQYHISKYSNIISSLKSEINELKSQLLKRDKQSGSTDSLLSKNVFGNNQVFEKIVGELKNICDEEISLKNRLYDQELTCHNLKITQQNKILDDIDDSDPQSIKSLTKTIENTKEKLKSHAKKREVIMTQWNKTNNSNDLQTKYLTSILKEHNIKLLQIEHKIKENYNFEVVNNKESYINELENQIKIRDKMLNNPTILEESTKPFKSMEEIKKDYSKLPMIYAKDKTDDISQLVYVNRALVLPPVSYDRNVDTSVNHGQNKMKKPFKAISNNVNLNYQKGNHTN